MSGQQLPGIAGTGTALPGPPIDNVELAGLLGTSAQWIDTFIGTRTRHLAVDLATGKQRTTLAELAEQAAAQAMAKAGVTSADIDFLVLATATPDELMPATVNRVADLLGVDRVPTYQLQSGCAGAAQALDLGTVLIGLPQHRVGLVIGGDVCARHLDLRRDFAALPPGELVNYVLFGDGAGAVVLTDRPTPGDLSLARVAHQVTGRGRTPGQVVRWFGIADRDGDEAGFHEDYRAIERHVPDLAEEALWQLLDDCGWSTDDVTYLLPPQLSGRMTALIAQRLGWPGMVEVSCVSETGNSGNALPFLQLDRLAGRIGPGDRAVGVCVEASKWLIGAFAVTGR